MPFNFHVLDEFVVISLFNFYNFINSIVILASFQERKSANTRRKQQIVVKMFFSITCLKANSVSVQCTLDITDRCSTLISVPITGNRAPHSCLKIDARRAFGD